MMSPSEKATLLVNARQVGKSWSLHENVKKLLSVPMAQAAADRVRGLTSFHTAIDVWQDFDYTFPQPTPRRERPDCSEIPPHVAKGLADAVNALPVVKDKERKRRVTAP